MSGNMVAQLSAAARVETNAETRKAMKMLSGEIHVAAKRVAQEVSEDALRDMNGLWVRARNVLRAARPMPDPTAPTQNTGELMRMAA